MARKNARSHVIPGAFVFLLLGAFAVLSTMLVLFGAQAYRNIVDRSQMHNQERILTAYVRNAVRADDAAGAIAVDEIDAIPVLTVTSRFDGEAYVKYIYVADGALRELFTSADHPFDPALGDAICPAQSLAARLEGNRLTVDLIDGEGRPHTLTMALRSQS